MNDTQPAAVLTQRRDRSASGPTDRFLEQLAERLGGQAQVRIVYGEPIERDGVTVIPVARVRWGFGGGAGSGNSETGQGNGQGGGGGVSASPAGYIEIANGRTQFRGIHDPIHLLVLAPLILATGISLVLFLRGLGQVLHPQPRGFLTGLQRPTGGPWRLRAAQRRAMRLG